jgi:hypothetical protein
LLFRDSLGTYVIVSKGRYNLLIWLRAWDSLSNGFSLNLKDKFLILKEVLRLFNLVF